MAIVSKPLLLHLVACGVVRGAPSPSLRVEPSVVVGVVDDHDHHHQHQHHRRLSCDGLSNKECKATAGCGWGGGAGCISTSTPPPTPPPVATDPPVPTKAPTRSPNAGGLGWCSDDSGQTCMTVADCGCDDDARARRGLRDGDGDDGLLRRRLNNGCELLTTARECKGNDCIWQGGGNCSPPAPGPSPPGPCECLGAVVPTNAPNTFGATYAPGDLVDGNTCDDGKLTLSKGLACRLLTTAGQPVDFTDGSGGQSEEDMHDRADGAAVIPHPSDGGWYYASNSETMKSQGAGVGTLRFDAAGEVIGYEKTLSGTAWNCGGGRTYWGTWVTCEENDWKGFCHEVDPHTGYTSQVLVTAQGGNYESFAYDDQDPDVVARFFTTEDSSSGALIRYTPAAGAFTTGDNYDILKSPGGSYDYLVLNSATGTFSWSSDISDGETSANQSFPNSEGIDVHNRILNFVSKVNRRLFTLDLDAGTYTASSTVSGAFNLQPDQLGRIVGEHDMLYFCEDGGSDCDVHGRDATGQYFTIIRGDGHSTENTGLAFSPDNMHMYFAMQSDSNIYDVWREDGLPFNGEVAYTKYHTN